MSEKGSKTEERKEQIKRVQKTAEISSQVQDWISDLCSLHDGSNHSLSGKVSLSYLNEAKNVTGD